jgi:saccharopine dehydrogenase-like NADP-dependent oxidoreductase
MTTTTTTKGENSMHARRVLLLGGGKIGRMIAQLLSDSGDYAVTVADRDRQALERVARAVTSVTTSELDADDDDQLKRAIAGNEIVISALAYYHNVRVARAALELGASYFDLTEDVQTTREVRLLAAQAKPGQVFMPQCGLAPGFVSVVAHDLVRHFDKVSAVRMRVGALPQFPSNDLKYNLTWSTDGLINEYCNLCEAIVDGQHREVLALEGLEHFSLDGVRYEAFNTSGGLGTLCDTLAGAVHELNYKTIRYLGHRDLAAFLVQGLRLSERRELLKDILEYAIPITFQDVVIVFCTASGMRRGQLVQLSDARKIYSHPIQGENWSAIQITTAAGVCTMVDLFCQGKLGNRGFLRQEDVSLAVFLDNRFGRHYETRAASRFSFGDHDREELT